MRKIGSILLFALVVISAQCYAVEPLPEYWSQWENEKGTFTSALIKRIIEANRTA